MTFDLREWLPILVPRAIAWAETQASLITQVGQPLGQELSTVARIVGVLHPELIRILEVQSLPLPDDPELRQAALDTGLLGPGMVGLTLGHGIYVCCGYATHRLLLHEFRHVSQYEQAGSIAAFLPVYLRQIVEFGYDKAPFEVDARAHERNIK